MERAVIYARFSSHKQREESIEGQVRLCREYANKNDLKIVDEYVDRAKSGLNLSKRTEALRLIEDAKKRKFTVVLIYKLDRLARDPADFFPLHRELEKNGVKVYSVEEFLGEGAQATLMLGIYAALNAYYSKELGEKVDRGMTENALKGYFNGSYRPLGYDVVDKHLVINEEEAEIVRKIFDMYAHGELVKSIIDYCSKRGFKNPKGKDFDHSYINRMLKNERYIGVSKWKEYTSEIEPIIEKDVFDKVQKILKENSNVGARAKAEEPYILVGKAFCGHCEQPLVADSVNKKIKTVKVEKFETTDDISTSYITPHLMSLNSVIAGSSFSKKEVTEIKKYKYYSCRGRKRAKFKNDCKKKSVDKSLLEYIVIKHISNIYLNDDNIKELAEAIFDVQNRRETTETSSKIKKKISEEEIAIENFYKMVAAGYASESTYKKIAEAEARKSDYEEELRKFQTETVTLSKKEIIKNLDNIKTKMLSYIEKGEIPIDVKKEFCDLFIDKVYVFDDDDDRTRIKIIFNAFESDGLFGFEDDEIEFSSISKSIGSPKTHSSE